MDFCRNVPVAGELPPEQVLPPPCSLLGVGSFTDTPSIDDLFLNNNNTEADFSMEWLSAFVEDCLSSKGNCLPAVPSNHKAQNPPKKPHELQKQNQQKKPSSPLQKLAFPSKPRSKRKRTKNPLTTYYWSHNSQHNLTALDPPLLNQTHWLADSELLVMPKKEEEGEGEEEEGLNNNNNNNLKSNNNNKQQVVGRRCSHCQAQRTPQWRAGPLGPKTLCNACGVRYKSGRLLPEYRPAKSPTFVSYLHSNSHKKVLEMRMMTLSSSSTTSAEYH